MQRIETHHFGLGSVANTVAGVEGESQARRDSLLVEAAVLFHDIVHVRRLPATAPLCHLAGLLRFSNLRWPQLDVRPHWAKAMERDGNNPFRINLKLVGAAGLEPATTCLEGRCSIHLSYAPALVF
jgi:hypothetical protein